MVACAGSGDVSLTVKTRVPLGWKEKVMFTAPWRGLCDSVSSFGTLLSLRGRCSKPEQAEHFQIPFISKYLLPKGSFEKAGLGAHRSPLVHTQIPSCRWGIHFPRVLVSDSRVRYPCAAPPLAAQIHSASPPWCPPPSPRGCQPPCA